MLNYALSQIEGLSEMLAPVGGPIQRLLLAIQHARNDEAQELIFSGICEVHRNSDCGNFSIQNLKSFSNSIQF